jgi:hypothetical protein
VFAAEPVTSLTFTPRPDAEPVALRFYPTARSPSYLVTGSEPIEFTDGVTGEVVAEVSVPEGMTRGLFLFTPASHPEPGDPGYNVQVLNDDGRAFPSGTLRLLNGSGLELFGTINGRAVSLRVGLNTVDGLGGTAEVLLRTSFRGRSYQAFADTIALPDDGRALLILLPPYRPGSVEVQSRVLVN